jgi:hypothetical protein
MRLKGKVALITGVSRGIGKGIAEVFADEGADIAINYVASGQAAEDVAAYVRCKGRRAMTVKADVANREEVGAMFAQVSEELGPIDILVNNAGLETIVPFLELTDEQWTDWELMAPSDASPEAIYRTRSTPQAASSTGIATTTTLPDSVRATMSSVQSEQFLFWVVMVWLAGAMVFWVRLAGGWVVAARMRSMLVRRAPPEWQETLRKLGAQIGLSSRAVARLRAGAGADGGRLAASGGVGTSRGARRSAC